MGQIRQNEKGGGRPAEWCFPVLSGAGVFGAVVSTTPRDGRIQGCGFCTGIVVMMLIPGQDLFREMRTIERGDGLIFLVLSNARALVL